MGNEDDEDPRPRLKVVSENRHLPDKAQRDAEFEAKWAMERAEQALADLAATILRTLAGSSSAAYEVMRRINDYADAHNRLRAATGRGMTLGDQQRVLFLSEPDRAGTEEYQIRRAAIDDAFHTIVKGALRLAAHKVLGEDPHFGGKYSRQVIEDGIRELQQAREWRARPPPPAPILERPPEKTPPSGPAPKQRPRTLKDPTRSKSKRWSPLESKSWRDFKNDE